VLEQAGQRQRLAEITVVVVDGDQGRLGQSIVQHLQTELPGIQLKAVGMSPEAAQAMAGQPYSAAALANANYVVGSWQSLSGSEIAPAVATAPATKFVVPLTEQDWLWTGLKPRSTEYYARQTVQGIKQAIDGEEINFGLGVDTGTIISIVGGVLLFLIVGSVMLGALLATLG
jgi:hypothetical protein